MPTARKAVETGPIAIEALETEEFVYHILGTTPLICNRMSEKARRQLLLPKGRMNAAERASNLKHDPLEEFRASPYTLTDDQAPTLIAIMASAFKGTMMTAALDLPGTRRAQIGRLAHVVGEYVAVYGEPHLMMSVTRSADIDKTPDIRSRVILPEWCCVISVKHVSPLLNQKGIVNLLAAGGTTSGVGDWRPEKGKGTYGQYTLVNRDDPEFVRRTQYGRAVQQRMMAEPVAYDAESESLLSWYDEELSRRIGGAKRAA